MLQQFSNPEIELPKFLHNYIAEENHVNLWAIAESHLRECGVKQAHIENPRICTFCNPEHFNSFRRDKTDERFCTVLCYDNVMRIGIIGCGHMGSAIAKALLEKGVGKVSVSNLKTAV